jgi:hypothetical protein
LSGKFGQRVQRCYNAREYSPHLEMQKAIDYFEFISLQENPG